ncbi:hypothetical protein CIB93_34110 [Streptomyces sp. WZ.A104]|uniref:hypothetical protein n=1 Tax=Streptomyces sp. WZ.A104 TaxID=2023771 RepID=UPI000BBBC0A8|nr:hypothetical protein [Streptomyces sp. WZ.A104]PCG81670.1 hypothetical protein CIB93_34110 [Streptomyces sp. WZ.A104]
MLPLLAILLAWPSTATAQEGRLKGWGANESYQLGGVVTNAKYKPVTVPGLTDTDIRSIDAGASHSLALLPNGTVESWGLNTSGQLGIGTLTNQDQASSVTGLRGVAAIC